MADPEKVHLKKYANRRLYNTEKSAYVTLNDVAGLIRQGRWVSVTDADTGEDVTAFTLTQIIMEEARKKNALLPAPLLHLIIRYGENILSDFFENYLEKILKNYIFYKNMADDQFGRWLEMGSRFQDLAKPPFSEMNPFQSFFRQFFRASADEKDQGGNDKKD